MLSEIIFIYAIDEKTPANFRLKVSIQGVARAFRLSPVSFKELTDNRQLLL